ncbi:putative mitochondrial protein, partial [Mucuna pruriens]
MSLGMIMILRKLLTHRSFIAATDAIKIHALVQKAIKDSNWVQAMKEEMMTLKRNSTWDIVDKLKDKRVVGCRWIYTVKCKFDGTLDRYKARLVAKGYTQTCGIDHEETFASWQK